MRILREFTGGVRFSLMKDDLLLMKKSEQNIKKLILAKYIKSKDFNGFTRFELLQQINTPFTETKPIIINLLEIMK